jgi:hypothetical protein
METKKVPVVSWVLHIDETLESELSSGGFDWYFTLDDARDAFEREVRCQSGGNQMTRLRLVEIEVPAELDGLELTNYLNDSETLDEIEETATPIQEIYTL